MKNSIIVGYTLLFCLYTHAQAQVDEHAPDEIAAIVSELAGDMVSIPAGSFYMGDLDSDWFVYEEPVNHVTDASLMFVSQITSLPDVEVSLRRVTFIMPTYNRPVHRVTVPAFKLGKYEVTAGQFRAFVVATGYRTDAERNRDAEGCYIINASNDNESEWTPGSSWRNPGYAVADKQPVVCVSWNDAQAFIDWLNDKTGGNYRLPSEAEWEYAARAGSTTEYSWGDDIGKNRANCDGCGSQWDNDRTAPVGSFSANAWGLHDMHGNVWEWVQDCWNDSYEGAPVNGRAWISGACNSRVIRGSSWNNNPWDLRSADRGWSGRSDRVNIIGFRLAQDE